MGSFTDLFIRRPVLATVVSLLVLLIGLQSIGKLPIRQFPAVADTKIEILTTYPGANADQIKGFITTPIQQAIASAEGIDTLTSVSAQNASTVTLKLKLDADGDRALADVLAKVNQVRGVLPPEANDPIVTRTTGPGYSLMYLGFSSKQMSPSQISDYLDRVVKPQLQAISGVAKVEILGGSTFAMRIWLDPDRMAALGLTPLDIRSALAANNFTTAAGEIKGDFVQTTINAETTLASASAFEKLVVATRNGVLIRLGQVARIELGPQQANSSSVFGGLKAVFLGIDVTPNANPLTTIEAVRNTVPAIQAQLPAGLEASIAYDATLFIKDSIVEVAKTLGEAVLIVIVVIFLFLGNVRSTLIPIVTIPLSIIGVMALLLLLGYSINLLTLLAAVLAIGLVVDDAIVVVENIHRHIETGMTPLDASLQGAREIALPVVAMTVTLAAVYAPIGFTSGLTGALFREFAFALAGAVIVSGVIALTLSPMMCSKLLRHETRPGWFSRTVDSVFAWLKRRYRRRLEKSLDNRALTIFVLAGVVALTGLLYTVAGKQLAPSEDQGIIFSFVIAPQPTNLDYLERYVDRIGEIFQSVPEQQTFFAINGTGSTHAGFAGILLKPYSERSRTDAAVLGELAPKLASVAGVKVFATTPAGIPIGAGDTPVEFIVQSPGDHRQLAEAFGALEKAANESGMFIFTNSDLKYDTPQIELLIDRDRVSQLGITMQDIGGTLATLLGGNFVNRFTIQGRSYEVIPQVPRDFRLSPEWLLRYQVRSAAGQMVPLSAFATIGRSVQPTSLNTFQQLNSAKLQGVPFPGRSLGEAIDFLEQKSKEILPAGMTHDFQGESRSFIEEGNTLAITFLFAIVIIYLVLAAQFESFRDPLIILVGLPASMFGALFALYLIGFFLGNPGFVPPFNLGSGTINIYTQIGLVTLIGLISKHGILMVEFANRLQEEQGLDRRAAIVEAASTRLRPILMTTAAMVIGMVPLLVAQGAGAKSRFDIGLVIACGMTVGTIFTLFITPAVYTLLARRHATRAVEPAAVELRPEPVRQAIEHPKAAE